MSNSTNHHQEIFFSDRDRPLGPIQENQVGKKVTVFCDQEFVIFLKYREDARFIEGGQSRFVSNPCQDSERNFEESKLKWHYIEIGFTEEPFPKDGLDYSVVTANGELDPRWVPPL